MRDSELAEVYGELYGHSLDVPDECYDAEEVCFIVPTDVAIVFNWNANDLARNNKIVSADRIEAEVDQFIGLCKHFQRVVFTYTNDHLLWKLPCGFRTEVDKVVARLTSPGIVCVNVNSHFQKYRDVKVST